MNQFRLHMSADLQYPIYVIGNQDGVLVLTTDGDDCVLLFHSQQLAERHLADNRDLALHKTLRPLAVPNADALRDGLRELPPHVRCVIWDADPQTSFVHFGVDELLLALDAPGGLSSSRA